MQPQIYIIFGGTFNPIHNSHLEIAQHLYNTFKTPVNFLPTGIINYKHSIEIETFDRINMLKLAINNHQNYKINYFEVNQTTFCNTYNTLINIKKELRSDISLIFAIGSDSLISLETWENWQKLFDLTHFFVFKRKGFKESQLSKILNNELSVRKCESYFDLYKYNSGKIFFTNYTPQAISSTLVRHNIKNNLAVEQLLPQDVLAYIKRHNLYL